MLLPVSKFNGVMVCARCDMSMSKTEESTGEDLDKKRLCECKE